MTTRRTFTAAEIMKILSSQTLNDDCALDLGNGLMAKQTATGFKFPDRPSFILERNGKEVGLIKDADEATLKELSVILWEKISPQFLDSLEVLEEKLTPDVLVEKTEDVLDPMTPDSLKEVEDPLAGEIEALTPDDLRPKKDDPNLEPDPLGLIPDALRKKKGPAEPALEDELTPDHLRTEK